LAIFSVAIVAWVGYANVQNQIHEEELPLVPGYVLGWGVVNDMRGLKFKETDPVTGSVMVEEGIAASYVTADGNLLSKTKYRKSYKVMAVCFFWDGLEDALDVKGISKSGLFDIDKGPIEIRIPWNEEYIRRVAHGERGSSLDLLLVPDNLSPTSFDSVREAVAHGAILVQKVGGPP
jgi:hypothetical protein